MKSILSLAMAGVLLAMVAAQAEAQVHPWSQRYSTFRRTGQSPAQGAVDGVVAWSYRIPGDVGGFAASANGDILMGDFFSDNTWSWEVYFSGIKPTGEVSFRRKVTPYDWGYSQGIISSPAIDPSGNIVLPSTKSQLIKFGPDVLPQWTINLRDGAPNDSSPAVLPDGTIRHYQFQMIKGFTPAGTEFLSTAASGGGSVAVDNNGNMAIVNGAGDQSNIYPRVQYYNAAGVKLWQTTGLAGGNASTPAFGPDGTLYTNPRGNTFFAYNPDGTVKWQDNASISGLSPALGDNGQVYSAGSQIRAYNKDTGAILWTTPLPGTAKEGIAIDNRNVIYLATTNGYIVSLSPNGTILWQTQVCETFRTGVIIGPNNLVIAYGKIGFERFVFAIR